MKEDPLNDGISFVVLESSSGTDLDIANAAKVSFHKQAEKLHQGEVALIKFLMKNKHGSPFEHNYFKFHIRAPLFVIREWMRHRIGYSYNEESGRYVELRPDFYIPTKVRSQEGRPGQYTFVQLQNEEVIATARDIVSKQSSEAYQAYKYLLDLGVAKEQARIVLPVNLYSEFYWSCNARSLMNFLSLRNSEDAMYEIQQFAASIEQMWEQKMPVTASAFKAFGRKAP